MFLILRNLYIAFALFPISALASIWSLFILTKQSSAAVESVTNNMGSLFTSLDLTSSMVSLHQSEITSTAHYCVSKCILAKSNPFFINQVGLNDSSASAHITSPPNF